MGTSNEFKALSEFIAKHDAEQALTHQRKNAHDSAPKYENLLNQYAATTQSLSANLDNLDKMPRALDIIRHEYLNCIYDLKLWKIRTNDDYPARRIKAMETFLKQFDESLK